ncbi:MAG: cobalt-precorrin-5B (C(1))-methyltransferase [Rhizobiales bacterium]|nr:cobalt-precorrin-5B (C(1))-methyltransferase [Hyphomicrobiales bacterium]
MAKTIAEPAKQLRRGWTTGACATAATKAAFTALLTGEFPDPVTITLPKGQTPSFALCLEGKGDNWAQAGIVKDAGDDPDVTHGATIIATVRLGAAGAGVTFAAGDGVGKVTKDGLPIAPGEPAINPVPRQMMRDVVGEVAAKHGAPGDVAIEISVPGGAALAAKTWNPRLGIVGGLSILGTTGIVNPFSCSAWIASIHRGIDVALAEGIGHIAGATGSTSEASVKAFHGLPDQALIDMGDFVGGMLKYIRTHPVRRVTVAGGFGKMTKMAQGAMDLHSGRSQVDFDWLGDRVAELGGEAGLVDKVRGANTAKQVFDLVSAANIALADVVAQRALVAGRETLRGADVALDTLVVDRDGVVIGKADG